MSAELSDLATLEPFKIINKPDNPDTDPLRFEVTIHPAPDKGGGEASLSHNRWAVDLEQSDEHFHPKFEERFEVLAGEYRVVVAGTDTTLTEGDDIVLPANVPHRHWNPTGQPARIRYDARPGHRGAELFETLYTLAQAGKTNEKGLPTPLQLAVLQDEYSGYIYQTALPKRVQQAIVKGLAPIGRLAGYEATYSFDEIDDLR